MTTIDWNTPRNILEQEAENNNPTALFYIALHSVLGTNGFDVDETKRTEFYLKAAALADHGEPAAQHCRGICYRNGYGVDTNAQEAVKWYRMAVEQDFAPAQTALGQCYLEGEGVVEDKQQAVELFRKAAEQGDPIGLFRLSHHYIHGICVNKDIGKAKKLLQQAAEMGFEIAYKVLETLGVFNKDTFQKHKKAAEQGDAEAQNRLGNVSLPDVIAKA